MKQFVRRAVSLMLIIVLVLSIAVPAVFAAQKNTGTRHELCTSLSDQALDYYIGDYSPDALVSYDTDTTGSCLKAVDSELYNVLQTLMTETQTLEVSYNSLTTYWKTTDCNNGSGKAQLFYSDVASNSYNREHVWPKSRAAFLKTAGGSDLHHLRPTDNDINSARLNYTFGNVKEMLSSYETESYNGKTVLWINGSFSDKGKNIGLVEVNDNIKGDVARILLYVYVRWEDKNLFEEDPNPKLGPDDDANNGLRVIYNLDTLLEWCEIDPVDTWEMKRNDAVQDVQGNRNVFIDYPELAWLLFGQEPPADMKVPEKLPLNETSYTVTAVSNNPQWGTVTQNGRRITANPNTGYYTEGYTVLSGQATVKRSDDKFTVTPESDCTIQINFAPKTPATANFNMGASAISSYVGETITLPTGTAPDGYRFVGWVLNEVEDTTTKPAYYEAGTSYTLSANVNFLALCSYTDGDGLGDWVIVTDADDLRSGIRLVIASVGDGVVAAPIGSKYMTHSNATFSSDGTKIEKMPNDAVVLTLGGQENAWTLTGEDGKRLGVVGSKNLAWNDGTMEWKITITDRNASIYSTKDTYGRILYNRSSPRFTNYTNSTSSTLVLPQLFTNDGGIVYYTTNPLKCDHSYETAVTAPTCTKEGYTTYTCSKCGHIYMDAVVEALGHDYVPEPGATADYCTEDEITYYVCTRCYDSYEIKTPAPGHDWDQGVETLAPTENETGIMTYTCLYCGQTKEESIPAIGCEYGDDCGCKTFTDMPAADNWAHAGIDFAVSHGLFNGMSATTFAPEKTMTRAMLVTVLWRSAGSPEAKNANFTDVPQGQWYSEAVSWAAEKELVNGMGDGTFRPDNQISREQLATILFRFAKLTEMDPPERADLSGFPDAKDVQSYAVEALQWAVEKGLVNGIRNSATGETFLRPNGSATRAQVATILMRFLTPGGE